MHINNEYLENLAKEADDLHDVGIAMLEKNDYGNAVNTFDKELKKLQIIRRELTNNNFSKAIAKAHYCRGIAFNRLNKLDKAVKDFGDAITYKSDFYDAYWNKSVSLLLAGKLEPGWEFYEYRWKKTTITPYDAERYPQSKLWLGKTSIAGKIILLHSEQGLGDTIQFCRYAKLVSDKGAQVIIEVEKSLVDLIKTLEGNFQVIPKDDDLPEFHYHCPIMSLPFALKTRRIKDIPFHQKYLKSDTIKLTDWINKLGPKEKIRIGIAWGGGGKYESKEKRDVSLSSLIQILPKNFQYVIIQPDVCDTDVAELKADTDLLDFHNDLTDFRETAALIELLDIVISVDTSVAHLAGALGKKVWILLPFNPDWRWLLNTTTSRWYNSATLYRQKRIGQWDGVFEKIKVDLLAIKQELLNT